MVDTQQSMSENRDDGDMIMLHRCASVCVSDHLLTFSDIKFSSFTSVTLT